MVPVFAHAYRRCMEKGLPIGIAPNVHVSIVMNPEECRWLLPPGERGGFKWRRWKSRTLQWVMGKLVTDPERMAANFDLTAGLVVAEPAYILLAANGHPDAHEAIRRLTLEAQATDRPLGELVDAAEDLAPYLAKFTPAQRALLRDPRAYLGAAEEKTQQLCDLWEQRLWPEAQ